MATINKENLIQLWKKIKSYVEEKLEDYPSTEQLPQVIEEALAGKNLPNPNSLVFTGAVTAEYDGSQPVTVEIDMSKYYMKSEIDNIMGSYITDINTLLGGDS